MSLEDINNLPDEIPAKHVGHRTDHEIIHSGLKAIVEELANKQDPVYRIYDEGVLIQEVPLNQFLTGLYEAMIFSSVITVEIPGYSKYLERDYRIVEELPSELIPNVIYIVRAPDGILTWHLPVLLADGGPT